MGPIQDRTKENLVSTDNAIIMARHLLRKAAQGLQKGTHRPASTQPITRVRSATFVLPVDMPFHTELPDAFVAKAGVSHTSI